MKTICFIDGENISHRKIDAVLTHIERKGEIAEIRLYGDFSRNAMKAWRHSINKHKMIVVDQPSVVAGKNTSDISLVVDAMDILHQRKGEFDAYAVITSDSDFGVLTRRIRRDGFRVDGYGEAKAPESFREACNNYYEYGETLEENARPTGLPKAYKKLIKLLKRAVESCCGSAGWAKMSEVGRNVRNNNPNIKHTDYGARKFADLFRNKNLARMFNVRKVGDTLEVKVAA